MVIDDHGFLLQPINLKASQIERLRKIILIIVIILILAREYLI